jgi:hypothetical protein
MSRNPRIIKMVKQRSQRKSALDSRCSAPRHFMIPEWAKPTEVEVNTVVVKAKWRKANHSQLTPE